MTQNKKHVIPKEKYGRKRREFFHNEEREQRVHLYYVIIDSEDLCKIRGD